MYTNKKKLTDFDVGLPAPCPDLVSMRISSGCFCCGNKPILSCSVAINFKECRGTTLSSWSPVNNKVAGY